MFKILKAFLCSVQTGIVFLAIIALMLSIEATWSVPLHNTIPFAIIVFLLMLSLALTVHKAIIRLKHTVNIRNIGFLLNHLGMLILLIGAYFGSVYVSRSKLMLFEGEASNVAYTTDNKVTMLPFSIALDDFTTTYYNNDSLHPKQFISHLTVDGHKMITEVNAPCSYNGYSIFQEGCDMQYGRYSILQLVRDPWLPVVFLGMAILACGSILLLFGRLRLKITIPLVLVLTILFTAFSIKKIEFDTLMPALRSWWFAPHILLYMMAYSLMFISIVAWLVEKHKKGSHPLYVEGDRTISVNLVRASSALLLLGMLTGSVWARQAWADYWAWDPKENWAAVTWLITLIYLHFTNKSSWMSFVILFLAFIALQITWYGVDYLPSAANSIHSYK